MYLDEFQNYKNQLLDDLSKNPEIIRLLSDKYEQDPQESIETLYRKQIFPFEHVPDTIEQGSTFLCFNVGINRMSERREAPSNKMIYTPIIYIWVFTHKSLFWLPDGGVRADRLVMEIAKTINGSHNYGMGSLELFKLDSFAPLTDYQGYRMIFDATDWNHPSPDRRPWPSNRRLGV